MNTRLILLLSFVVYVLLSSCNAGKKVPPEADLTLKDKNASLEKKNDALQNQNAILQEKLKKDNASTDERKPQISSEEELDKRIYGQDFSSKMMRPVNKRVFPKNLSQSGKVTFQLCIDRKGNVIYTKIDRSKTTITDGETLSDVSHAMRKTTFEADSEAPVKECGTWTMTIKSMD